MEMTVKATIRAAVALLAIASSARAGLITSTGTAGGYDLSATASASFSTDTIKLTLTNTTPVTHDASQLLTGFEFVLPGLTDLTLAAGSAKPRAVAADGSYSDGKAVDLLTAGVNGDPTWDVESLGGDLYRVTFNPDAWYAIIGPPETASYAQANNSITDNPGHDAYAAESVSLTLSAPGVTRPSAFQDTWFLYGTNLETVNPGGSTTSAPPAPEPASLALLAVGAGALLIRRRRCGG